MSDHNQRTKVETDWEVYRKDQSARESDLVSGANSYRQKGVDRHPDKQLEKERHREK